MQLTNVVFSPTNGCSTITEQVIFEKLKGWAGYRAGLQHDNY
jgi:hypothetical protein